MPASHSRSAESSPFLRLRFSSLLALVFLGVAALALAYVGGVMTGRASASAERRLAAVEAGRAGPAAPVEAGRSPAPDARAPQEAPGILSPEELRFARALRNEDGAPEPQGFPARAAPTPVVTPQASAVPLAGQPGAASEPGAPVPGGGAVQAPPVAASAPMQDYVFQVGAFRDEESVDGLRQRLEGRGLRTRMQKEGKLYVVLVLLRGDAARAGEVMRIAEELRLGKPMIRSRKPVQQ